MKRLVFAIVTIAVISIGYAQLQRVLPPSVERFYGERALAERLDNSGNTHAKAMLKPTMASPRMIDGVEMIDAFISIDNEGVINSLKADGVIVNCTFDGFVTAQIPVNKLTEVSLMKGVTDVEISPIAYMSSDSTLVCTNAGNVIDGMNHGLPQDYDGTGVVIGIIDNGFDFQHIAFRRADDTTRTRIVRVYDPQDTVGHPAKAGTSTLPGLVRMGDEIYGLTYDLDKSHGTHVAGIAAGTHVGGYGGMAPGADIVLCVSRTLNNQGIMLTEVANCMKYIFAYADSVGKPCVVNLSYSTADGAHDGKDYLSAAVAQCVGPGRIFVTSAGNNGQRPIYASGPATVKKPYHIFFETLCDLPSDHSVSADNTYYYGLFNTDSWIRASGSQVHASGQPVVKFHIFDRIEKRIVWESKAITSKDSIFEDSYGEYYEPDTAVSNKSYMYAITPFSVRSNKYEISTQIYNLKSKEYTTDSLGRRLSRYHIGLTVYPRTADSLYVDSWVCRDGYWIGKYNDAVNVDNITARGDTAASQATGFYAEPSNASTMCPYAVHDSVISAGAYCARNTYYALNRGTILTDIYNTPGRYATFTSSQTEGCGPTGKALPTVMAPGTNVVSAVSRYSEYNTQENNSYLVMRTEDGYTYATMSGTSLAAPTVAGIVAQWLQINPNLAPSDVKGIIAQTAIKDEFTQDPNNYYRYGPNGKIDAMAGVKLLLGIDYIVGDVNGDGKVAPSDISALIDYLLGNNPEAFDERGADVNQDGQIKPDDISLLIDMLLGNVDLESID